MLLFAKVTGYMTGYFIVAFSTFSCYTMNKNF